MPAPDEDAGISCMIMLYVSEGDIDTEVDFCIRIQRYTLLGEFAKCVVHTQEEVEAGHVDIYQPSETYAVSAGHHIS